MRIIIRGDPGESLVVQQLVGCHVSALYHFLCLCQAHTQCPAKQAEEKTQREEIEEPGVTSQFDRHGVWVSALALSTHVNLLSLSFLIYKKKT